MPLKMIQVGCGGFGGSWCARFLPPNVEDGLIEVVAAADVNPEALANAREHLGLRQDQCYTDVAAAFAANPADFTTIVVPPSRHESIVDLALAHDLHILSEKPIADTLEGSARIAAKVKRAGKKMGVTMSHRFDQDKTTLRRELRSGRHGALDYLVCRFTCDCRRYGHWGKFRYEIPDTLMVEGAVHHLDILADLAGADCQTIYAQTWNPNWGDFKGDSQALVTMQFANGARAVYEGAKTNAAGLNGWANEYIRAECEDATLIMDHRQIDCFPFDPEGRQQQGRHPSGQPVALAEQPKWANAWLIEKFVRWLEGGEPMETNVEANLQSVALIFGAIASARSGQPVAVQELLADARIKAETRMKETT